MNIVRQYMTMETCAAHDSSLEGCTVLDISLPLLAQCFCMFVDVVLPPSVDQNSEELACGSSCTMENRDPLVLVVKNFSGSNWFKNISLKEKNIQLCKNVADYCFNLSHFLQSFPVNNYSTLI